MLVLALLLVTVLPAAAQSVSVPSGQPLELVEAFWDDANETSPTLRLRFLAPEIGGRRDFDDVEGDFLQICETVAAPLVAERPDALIVISMSDRPIDFGAFDPEATQYFEGFRIERGRCVWEGL